MHTHVMHVMRITCMHNMHNMRMGYTQQEDRPPRDSARRLYLPCCLPCAASLADHPADNLDPELSGI